MTTTAPRPNSAAVALLDPDRLAVMQQYADLLCGPGIERGLLGPREADQIWDRHLLNCFVVQELIPSGATVLDCGSGAGLPGIPLAIGRPDSPVTLVEPLARRAAFLSEVVQELALTNVTVVRSRVEDLPSGHAADVVTARAVAPLEKLVRWSLPVVASGGKMAAIKGAHAVEEVERSRVALRRWGVSVDIVLCGEDQLEQPTTVVTIGRGPSRDRRGRTASERR